MRQVFAAELALRDEAGRQRLLDAVYVAAGGPTWELLRHDRGLAVEDAQEHVRRHLTTLLDPSAPGEDHL